MKLLPFLILFLFSAFGAEVNTVIKCQTLSNENSCRMHREGSNFLDVNGRPIYFYTGRNCSDKNCDWNGKASSYDLKVGSNDFLFKTRTVTDDRNIYAKDFFKFVFNGITRHTYVSERRGYDLDTDRFSFSLKLRDIDPELYDEFKRHRQAALDSERQRARFEERMEETQKALDQAYEKLRYLDELYQEFENGAKDFEDLTPELLEKAGLGANYIDYVSGIGVQYENMYEEADQAIKEFERTQAYTQAKLKKKLALYEVELEEPNVRPRSDNGETENLEFVREFRRDLDQDRISLKNAVGQNDSDAILESIKRFQLKSSLAKELAHSKDLSAMDKTLLFEAQLKNYELLFKYRITSDGWLNKNDLEASLRRFVDYQIEGKGSEEFKRLKDRLISQKLSEEDKEELKKSLNLSQELERKLENTKGQTKLQAVNHALASAALKEGTNALIKGIESVQKIGSAYFELSQKIYSFGLSVLDFGLDTLPVVGGAKSAYALATGVNPVTKEKLGKTDMAIEGFALVAGFVGGGAIVKKAPDALAYLGKIFKSASQKVESIFGSSSPALAALKKNKKNFQGILATAKELGLDSDEDLEAIARLLSHTKFGRGVLKTTGARNLKAFSLALTDLKKTGLSISKESEKYMARQVLNSEKIFERLSDSFFDKADLIRIGKSYDRLAKKFDEIIPAQVDTVAWRGIGKTKPTRDGPVSSSIEDVFSFHTGVGPANHRYSMPGDEALYASLGGEKEAKKTILAEFGVSNPDDILFSSKKIQLSKVLDLTDPEVLKTLGVRSTDLILLRSKKKKYEISQQLGNIAQLKGYQAIKALSAPREGKGINIILFKEAIDG